MSATALTETPAAKPVPNWRNGYALIVLLLALLAFLAPFFREETPGERIGALLIITAIVELLYSFKRTTRSGQISSWLGAAITLAMGLLLINSPLFAANALLYLLAGWFGLDAFRYFIQMLRGSRIHQSWQYLLLCCLGNLVVIAILLIFREKALHWLLPLAGGLRMIGVASNMVIAPIFTQADAGDTIISDLNLPDCDEVKTVTDRIVTEEKARASIDRGWIIGFILTLFAIHLSRMGFDRSALGILSPVLAVLGDLFLGLMIAFILVIPLRVFWLRSTRFIERRLWNWCLNIPVEQRGWARRGVEWMLTRRLRSSIRLRQARLSLPSAFSRAMQIGLPIAAIIAAIVPVLGMSWYFDTENWAAGAWDSWAAHRTDDWREAMVQAVLDKEPGVDLANQFTVHPDDLKSGQDFSFIVIGDTGEGDASQHSLRAQYLDTVKQHDVKFVVVSSDVVYPTGAMRDYEANFWLPFMGTTKPVYAIPGNHDWYDALEAFVATFYEPAAARTSMLARIEVDKRITTTTEKKVDQLIAEATRLRGEYRVPTQFQKAPYFQFQTDRFALFAIDTGVVKRIDPVQMKWFKAALASAKGKTKMAILGHPLYAGGQYMAEDEPDFAEIHALLKEHEVAIVMAGDTHDMEYYLENPNAGKKTAHHFVNGGGGAYLSYGTSLAWPAQPPTKEWAYYPAKRK
ncbi:MAG: metallophosphoesterase [Gemmatales bacterium]